MFVEAFSFICKYGLLTSTLFTFHGRTCHNGKLHLRCPLDTSIAIEWAHYGVIHDSKFRCKEFDTGNHKRHVDFLKKEIVSKKRRTKNNPAKMFLDLSRRARRGRFDVDDIDGSGRDTSERRLKQDGDSYKEEARVGSVIDDDITLSNLGSKDCLAKTSLKVVMDYCEDKQKCRLEASDEFFGSSQCDLSQLEVAYKCVPDFHSKTTACLGTQMYIQCPASYRVLILSANYGYSWPGENKCSLNPGFNTECTALCSTYIVTKKCHGRKRCRLFVDSNLFGDPCAPGTQPYLTVYYACVQSRILKRKIDKRTFPFNECVNPPSNTSYFNNIDVFQPIFHTTTISHDPESDFKWFMDHRIYAHWLYTVQFIKDNLEKAFLCALVSALIGLAFLLVFIILLMCCRLKNRKSVANHRVRPVFLDHTDRYASTAFKPLHFSRELSSSKLNRNSTYQDDIEVFRSEGRNEENAARYSDSSKRSQFKSYSSEVKKRRPFKRRSNLLDHLGSLSGESLQFEDRNGGFDSDPQKSTRITSLDRFSFSSPKRFSSEAPHRTTFASINYPETCDNNVVYDNHNDSPVFIHVESPRESPVINKSSENSNEGSKKNGIEVKDNEFDEVKTHDTITNENKNIFGLIVDEGDSFVELETVLRNPFNRQESDRNLKKSTSYKNSHINSIKNYKNTEASREEVNQPIEVYEISHQVQRVPKNTSEKDLKTNTFLSNPVSDLWIKKSQSPPPASTHFSSEKNQSNVGHQDSEKFQKRAENDSKKRNKEFYVLTPISLKLPSLVHKSSLRQHLSPSQPSTSDHLYDFLPFFSSKISAQPINKTALHNSQESVYENYSQTKKDINKQRDLVVTEAENSQKSQPQNFQQHLSQSIMSSATMNTPKSSQKDNLSENRSLNYVFVSNPSIFTNPFRNDETMVVRSSKLPKKSDFFL